MYPGKVVDSAPCLDMLHVTWRPDPTSEFCDDAILLEVSRRGGMLHVGLPMPPGLQFQIDADSHDLQARVQSCEFDGYGFVVRFTVASRQWYPWGFHPANLKVATTQAHGNSSHAA